MKYKEVKTTPQVKNDCEECCFALACIEPCRLKKGYHYEKMGD